MTAMKAAGRTINKRAMAYFTGVMVTVMKVNGKTENANSAKYLRLEGDLCQKEII